MKNGLKYTLYAVLSAMLAAVCTLLMVRAAAARSLVTCDAIDIRLKDSLRFVDPESVRQFVDKEFSTLIGQRVDSLPLALIEEKIMSRGAVKSCEAWTDRKGTLHIDIRQRRPVMRFDYGNGGFYIDDRGLIFPLHRSYTADVTSVYGSIPVHVDARHIGEAPEPEEREWIASMLDLSAYVSRSRQWRGQIKKITIAPGGDVCIMFEDSPETFNIGRADKLDDKFGRISLYLSRIKPLKPGYRTVNVKYNNQIVCRKDI